MKKYFNGLKELNVFQRFIYVLSLLFLVGLIIIWLNYFMIMSIILSVIVVIVLLYAFLSHTRFIKYCSGNGIVYGGRGKGKGVLYQKRINADKKVFSNVPYGKNTEIINPLDYVQSIGNNTIFDSINGTIKVVKKIEMFEGVNVYWDDTNLYFPNFEDALLKKLYPSFPLTLAVNRHLYNAFFMINVQAPDRPYKLIRELQTDFSIKALKSYGTDKSYIWNSIPFLRNFMAVKYRYYEEIHARDEGVLPFKAKGVLNEGTKHLYLTSGQATKEEFEARYGKIFNAFVFIRKSKIYYDTRYFHRVFYGYKSPTSK